MHWVYQVVTQAILKYLAFNFWNKSQSNPAIKQCSKLEYPNPQSICFCEHIKRKAN